MISSVVRTVLVYLAVVRSTYCPARNNSTHRASRMIAAYQFRFIRTPFQAAPFGAAFFCIRMDFLPL